MMAMLPHALLQSADADFIKYRNGNRELTVSMNNGRYKAEIVTAREVTGKPATSVREIGERTGAYACFNGGFFEPDYSPSGLFVRKGKLITPFVRGKGDGVLYIGKDGGINIGFREEFGRSSDIVDAVQLVLLRRNGRPYYKYDEKYPLFRGNMIGLTAGRGFAGMVFDRTNYTLGDLHMASDHGCTDVAMLDSGKSASLFSDKKEIGGNPDVANFLLIYKL